MSIENGSELIVVTLLCGSSMTEALACNSSVEISVGIRFILSEGSVVNFYFLNWWVLVDRDETAIVFVHQARLSDSSLFYSRDDFFLKKKEILHSQASTKYQPNRTTTDNSYVLNVGSIL